MKIVIIGSGGRLGAALRREYQNEHDVRGVTHAEIDLAEFDELEQLLSPMQFDLLINCAALTNVDLCEEQPEQAFRVNAGGAEVLAQVCEDRNVKLIHFSTDYVFDGEKRTPYLEEDEAKPISVYGQSKREGEESVLAMGDGNLVVRLSWVFGPDRPSFIDGVIQRARENAHVDAIADKFSTPTYTRDIARMLPRFFDANVPGGLLHFTNTGECSWQEYAQHALDCCRESGIALKAKEVGALRLADMERFVASRPVYSVLSTAKYDALAGSPSRPWRDAVAEYVRECVAGPGR